MYSLGIICHEIIDGSGPFNTYDDSGIGADGQFLLLLNLLLKGAGVRW